MTNWERIKQFVNVDKDYLIKNFGIIKDVNENELVCKCSCTSCADCLFYGKMCIKAMADYLEKEVNENE